MSGKPWTEEMKRRASERMRGKKILNFIKGSPEWEAWRSKLKKPKPPRSEEHGRKISLALAGRKLSEGHRIKSAAILRKARFSENWEKSMMPVWEGKRGVPRNPEHIAKMAATNRQRGNYIVADHVREAVGRASRNRKRTEEEKAKIADSLRGRKRDPEIAKKISATKRARRTRPYPEKRQKDPRYKPWRDAVLQRDGYACKRCGVVNSGHHAHHVKPWSDYPELRYDVSNAITLCDSCHAKTHWEERRKSRAVS